MSTTKLSEWPMKRKSVKARIDPEFKKFIEGEYPNATGMPERTRRILDELLYGKKRKK